MSLKPAAVCIIFDRSATKILLVKRKDVPVWVLPGGGVDAGESFFEAAIREAYEETGCHIIIKRQSGWYYPINRLATTTAVYVCQWHSGTPSLSAETAAIEFFPLHGLPKELFFVHLDWIKDALSSPTLLKKPLKQVNYLRLMRYFLFRPHHVLCHLFGRFFKKE